MNKIKYVLFATMMTLMLAPSAKKLDMTKESELNTKIRTQSINDNWINGLLIGKDMSLLSQSYASQLNQRTKGKSKDVGIKHNNYLANFHKKYKSYVNDINQLSQLGEQELEKKWHNKVAYLQKGYQQAKNSQRQLLD